MGIKSGFNSISQMYIGNTPIREVYYGTNLVFTSDRGKLSLWRYSNDVITGKTLLYEYLGSWNNEVYVPKCKGNSIINDYYSSSSVGNTPFYNTSVNYVNLQGVPFRNNNMRNAFYNCINLKSIRNIPNSVVNMTQTFQYCRNLNQNIQIPSNVTNMYGTFYDCSNLNQNIQIPKSVTNMYGTFYGCYNLNQNINIPKNVTSIFGTFDYCRKMGSWINIYSPNITQANVCFSVTNTPNVFFIYKFINNSVTPTFNSLRNAGWNVNGEGVVVGDLSPIRCWDDRANYTSKTYNGTHCILGKWHGTLDTFLNNNVTWTTPEVPTRLFLSNIPVALDRTTFKGNTAITSVDFGSGIPWSSNIAGSGTNVNNRNAAFRSCTNLTSVKGDFNYQTTGVVALFDECSSLVDVDVIFPELATSYYVTYGGIGARDVAPLGSGATNCQSMLWGANNLVNSPVFPTSVTSLKTTFINGGMNQLRGNIYVLSPSVSTVENMVRGHNTSLRKNIYIPFTYSNGVSTITYNTFKKQNVFKGTSGNSAGTNPMYNSTSNFYVYDLATVYKNLWNYTCYIVPAHKAIKLIKYLGNDPHVAVMANYPDWTVNAIDVNCFNNCRNIRTLALYGKAIFSPYANSTSNLFRDCHNLRVVQGLAVEYGVNGSAQVNIGDMSNTYANCYNLRVARAVGSYVTNIAFIYSNCYNLNFNVQLGNNSINARGAFYGCNRLNREIEIPYNAVDISDMFYGCSSLNRSIQIPNKVQNIRNMFYGCTNLSGRINILSYNITNSVNCFYGSSKFKEVHIPFRYSNGKNTKTFNSFVNAGYLYKNGASTRRNNTVFYDLSY